MGNARPIGLGLEIGVVLASTIWIAYLVARPVHIPVLQTTGAIEPMYAKVLSGVRGQTFVAPSSRLSRVDLWLNTGISPESWIRVKFELAEGVQPRTTLVSAIAVFDRSRVGWPVQLSFDPTLVQTGDELYLRLESILGSASDRLAYWYSRKNLYPSGDFLDLNVPCASRLDHTFHCHFLQIMRVLGSVSALARGEF